jgi:two-component system sensor histidine kinase PilS (NtrC family)
MAHEIRNPLAALCGSVQLLSSANSLQNSDSRLLAIVTREAEQLEVLISEFLMYARPTKPKTEQIALFDYIKDEFLFIGNDPRFINVELQNLVPESAEVIADRNQLHQVIFNLMQNAADAMPDGGWIKIGYSQSAESDMITVADNGSGIAAEDAQHLFEPFWTTKTTGSGLGLAISYRIIEAHGGSLSVGSPPDGGCRFVISLPRQ